MIGELAKMLPQKPKPIAKATCLRALILFSQFTHDYDQNSVGIGKHHPCAIHSLSQSKFNLQLVTVIFISLWKLSSVFCFHPLLPHPLNVLSQTRHHHVELIYRQNMIRLMVPSEMWRLSCINFCTHTKMVDLLSFQRWWGRNLNARIWRDRLEGTFTITAKRCIKNRNGASRNWVSTCFALGWSSDWSKK